MSRETAEWLDQNVLTMKRAWHQDRDSLNIYPDGVPIDAVLRKLDWQAVSAPLYALVPADLDTMTTLGPNGEPLRSQPIPNQQAIVRSDTGEVFYTPSKSYQIHQHQDTVVRNVQKILDGAGELIIGSFGLLSGGAIAWLSVELRDTIKVNDTGVEFLPRLLAIGSHNGKHATTYKQVVTNVVCDNTMAMALRETTEKQFRIKHSSRSEVRVLEARDALDLLDVTGQTFAASTTEAVHTSVTNDQWFKFLDVVAAVDPGQTVRTRNFNTDKRDQLTQLWNNDLRVSPWKNTAWGVVQAVNTWEQWTKKVKVTSREERNTTRTISGDFDDLDRKTLTTLDRILTNA